MFPVHEQNRMENILNKGTLPLNVNKDSASTVHVLLSRKDGLTWYPANINVFAVMPRRGLPVTALQFKRMSKAPLLQVHDFKNYPRYTL